MTTIEEPDALAARPLERFVSPRRTQGGVATTDLVLSARVSGNADIFPDVLKLHVPEGWTVADVTHGGGVKHGWRMATSSGSAALYRLDFF